VRRVLLVVSLVGLVAAVPAVAIAAAKPIVPPFIQQLALKKAGPLAYAPTRVPFGYRYTGYSWVPASKQLTFRFDDKHYAKNGKHALRFTAEPFAGTLASCADGKQKTLQLDGNKVYWDGGVAWRCVRGSNGKLVKLLAAGPNLPDSALGIVVASGKRIAS
jgi:hypothetical protein